MGLPLRGGSDPVPATGQPMVVSGALAHAPRLKALRVAWRAPLDCGGVLAHDAVLWLKGKGGGWLGGLPVAVDAPLPITGAVVEVVDHTVNHSDKVAADCYDEATAG